MIPADDEIQRVYLDVSDPSSTLLSIYVRARKPRTADEFAQRIAPLMQRLLPTLFERYPGVTAIDLCQEEPNDATSGESPASVTRILVLRSDKDAIDWDNLDLAKVRGYSRLPEVVVQLEIAKDVAKSPTFRAAQPS